MGDFPPLHVGWDFPSPLMSGGVEDKDDEHGGSGTGGVAQVEQTRTRVMHATTAKVEAVEIVV